MMRRGFSLFELLIALGLSAFIMLGMIQGYRNAARLLQSARNMLVINRRVALLFNQMERDVTAGSTYYKPVAYQQPVKKKPGAPEQPKQHSKNKKKERPVNPFTMDVIEDDMYKYRGQKRQTTKIMNLLCTTPLEVFGNEQERMVRVGYELTPNKKKPGEQSGPNSYTLYRKQTHQLANEKFKEQDDAKQPTVGKHIVAEKVKHFSVQATYIPRPPEQKDKSGKPKQEADNEKQEPVKTFVWTSKEQKKSTTALPEYFSLHLELWDDAMAKSHSFECMMPCFVRDPLAPRPDDDAKDEKEKGEKQKEGDDGK